MTFAWWRNRKARRAAQQRRVEATRRRLRMAQRELVEAAALAAELRQRVDENRFAPMLVKAFRGEK